MIGLMDCNNFFVSCERLFRPDLERKPVAVLSGNDGCIVARSQEVKDLGITMGVPLFQVKDICKREGVVLFSGNHTLYRDISRRVMNVLQQEVGECEVYSIDEAFFTLPQEVTEDDIHIIRDVVMRNVGIPVSIGVAHTKTLAKRASTMGKKGEGVCLLQQKDWEEQAKEVKCGEVWGLGRQTVTKLNDRGVTTASEYMNLERRYITQTFGVSGERIYDELHGISVVPLEKNSNALRKSITSTRSFAKTTTKLSVLESALSEHMLDCAQKLRARQMVTGKVLVQMQTDQYSDFFMQGASREIVFSQPTASTTLLLKEVLASVRAMYTQGVPYKKTGVVCSDLMPETYITADLFQNDGVTSECTLDSVVDALNQRFGKHTVQPATVYRQDNTYRATLRSVLYTTQWKDIPIVYAKEQV